MIKIKIDRGLWEGDTAFILQCSPFVYPNSNNPKLSKVVGQVKVAPKSFGVTKYMGAGITLPEALAMNALIQAKTVEQVTQDMIRAIEAIEK